MVSDDYKALRQEVKEIKELLSTLIETVLPPAESQSLTIKDLMRRWQCSYPAAYQAMHSSIMKATKPKKQLIAELKNVKKYEEMYRVNP